MGTESSTVTEFVDNRGVALTTEEGVIRGVKVMGYESANRRTYKRDAVRKALPLYEGAAVHVNHGPAGKEEQPRGYDERIGILTGVREASDGVYADLNYNPKHALAPQLEWDAKHASQKVGLSPVHYISGSRQPDGRLLVEAITKVFSVDLVTGPGTTRTLFESLQQEPEEMSLTELTIEQLKTERPDLIATLEAEQKQGDEVATLTAKVATLTQQVATFQAREQAAAVESEITALCAEHKLPESVVTEDLLAVLREAKDATARQSIVKPIALALSASITEQRKRAGKPVSREQGSGGLQTVTSEQFLAAIC